MDVVIRQANEKDLEQIINLSAQLGYPTKLEDAKKRFDEISKSPDHCLLVAEKETIVGWVHVIAIQEMLNPKTGEIRGLIIDEHHQGQGIGKLLMRSAEDWVKSRGYHTVRVNSNTKRLEAHKFYEKIGYPQIKTQAIFEKEF